MTPACACLELGPRRPDVVEERYVGQDPTDGRFADVAAGPKRRSTKRRPRR